MSMKEHVDLLVNSQGPKVRHRIRYPSFFPRPISSFFYKLEMGLVMRLGISLFYFSLMCFTARKSDLLVTRIAQWSTVSGEKLHCAQGSQNGESSPQPRRKTGHC